jgi:general L-amino acid transport system permease protein
MSASINRAPSPPRGRADYGALALQAGLIAGVAALVWFFLANAQANMAARGLQLGLGFLGRPSNMPIGEVMIAYRPSDSYARALLVGLMNTLRVATIGCVLATLLGVAIGLLQLSGNPLLAALTSAYVEALRNVPVLLQLVFWHALLLRLPPVRAAFHPLPGVYLSQRGVVLPAIEWNDDLWLTVAAIALAVLLAVANARRARRHQAHTGKRRAVWHQNLALLLALPAVAIAASGTVPDVSVPALAGFNFEGGLTLSPEFAALLFGLTVYASAFIAEIVRAGIQAVDKGQWEAARALGLRDRRIVRLIILPQALRVIVPPLTSQYLNLTKNSSLAVVIGYPDLVSVASTAINQTGQAIEIIAIFMTIYLALSLLTAAAMAWYNRRIALRGSPG